MSKENIEIFWNLRKTLTYNKLINIIVGNRGGGKSYGAKEWAIDNFIKNKEQFGYIRRYKEDLRLPMVQFFEDIKHKYPDYEFKTDTNYFYIRLKPSNPKKRTGTDKITANSRSSSRNPRFPFISHTFSSFLLTKTSLYQNMVRTNRA